MAEKPATPEQLHREHAIELHRDPETEVVRCAFIHEGVCRGRLQAAHYIEKQKIKRAYGQATIAFKTGKERRPILNYTLEELVADGRNSLIACERHHGLFDRMGLEMEPPALVVEFATDTGLERYLPERPSPNVEQLRPSTADIPAGLIHERESASWLGSCDMGDCDRPQAGWARPIAEHDWTASCFPCGAEPDVATYFSFDDVDRAMSNSQEERAA